MLFHQTKNTKHENSSLQKIDVIVVVVVVVVVIVLLVLLLYAPVNSYGHRGAVSSPNHTFSLTASNSCTYFRL